MKTLHLGPEPAAVGQFYSVPCLHMPVKFYGEKWVPVIGPKHRDPELLAHFEHWHIDWRFASDRMHRHASMWSGTPHGKVISSDSPDPFALQTLTGKPEPRRRKCKRDMPAFPAQPKLAHWVAMESGYRERCARLKDGHTCPHRNIDLRPFAQADGTAICPGHGLRWNLTTGELIARHAAP